MLILKRKRGQAILIGTEIEVIILSNNGKEITIGFIAPDHVSIVREELSREEPTSEDKTYP